MYSMVLMAALTTGMDMPDRGRRGGGCCGCCGGGMVYGGGYGGCYGGYARGGWGGGCYGGGMGYGGMGWGGWGGGYGGGYGGYVMGGFSPWSGGYAYSPMIYNYGTPVLASNTNMLNSGMRSFYYTPAPANEATLIVHLPADANLTIGGQPTQSTSGTRVFYSPPLEAGKMYTYTLRAEINRDGRLQNVKKTVNVEAGRSSEVTLDFRNAIREDESNNAPPPDNRIDSATPRRTLPRETNPSTTPRRTLPRETNPLPPDR